MEWVTIEHPGTGGRARVARSALPFHLRAGWQEAPDPQLEYSQPDQSEILESGPGDGQAAGPQPKTSRRRADTTRTGE